MNPRRLLAMARKEAIHIRRDPRSLGLAAGIPMLMLLMFGYALTLDVNRVPVVVRDQSGTPESRALVARFTATRYFDLRGAVADEAAIAHALDSRRAMVALVSNDKRASTSVETLPGTILRISFPKETSSWSTRSLVGALGLAFTQRSSMGR